MPLPENAAIDLDEADDDDPALSMAPAPFSVRVPVAARAAEVVAAPAAERVAMFDAMRVVAAFGVVWAHTPLTGVWHRVSGATRFGVAFFLIAAMILLARSLARRPGQRLADYAAARASRLLLPLALWSVIYVAFYWAVGRFLGGRNDVQIGPGLLLGGAAIHLWFLPFVLVACVAAFPVLKFGQTHPEARTWLVPVLGMAAAVAMFLPTAYPTLDRGTRIFLETASWSVPTTLAGVAIALVYPRRLNATAATLLTAAGFVLFAAAAYAAWTGVRSPAVQLAKGVAVAMVALSPWSPPAVTRLAKLGTLSFGVYLVHLLFVTLFRELGGRIASPAALWFYPAVAVLAFAASYGCAVAFNRTRVGKVLFP